MRKHLFNLTALPPFRGIAKGRAHGEAEPQGGGQEDSVRPEIRLEEKDDGNNHPPPIRQSQESKMPEARHQQYRNTHGHGENQPPGQKNGP
jgi:hypothetical protein